jgi:acyl-coenzyme A thioesterase PaaI-like protein
VSGARTFDEATTVRAVSDGRFTAEVAEGWDVRGNPHGGYLLALVTRAMGLVAAQPDPISVSATYLAPPRFGHADITVAVVRVGRRQTTVGARLVQDDLERVNVLATFGTLPDEPARVYAPELAARPALPRPDDCLPAELLDEVEGEVIELHQRLQLRFHPDTGWLQGRPSGVAELNGWMRHVPDRDPDPLALLMFSDGMPPSLFEAVGRSSVHTPTVQLTTHLFGLPAPGWVQGRFRTRVAAGGFLDEDGELWDADGKLVGTTRQLALLRTAT